MILVTGGTGFVGRNVVKKLLQKGVRKVRCLVRKTGRREVLEGLNLELFEGDIASPESLDRAMKGVKTVIHIVGIICENPPEVTFERVHAEGTANVVAAAKKAGVTRFVHMSAMGARPDAPTRYHTTKWAAEESVRSSGIPFVIFRPSIICGEHDEFVNMFAGIMRQTWFLPVFNVIGSGQGKMQPVYVGDVAHCFVRAATDKDVKNKAYDLGGPEQLTIDEIMDTIMKVIGAHKKKIHMPIAAAWPMAYMMEKISKKPMLTREQLIMLRSDNVGDITDAKQDFALEPMRFEDAIRTYLTPK
ncbi:MAG: complex I NDUFA9 subunit family protein [Planctomycetota bacterium]|jgi:NADH dehydrogenase